MDASRNPKMPLRQSVSENIQDNMSEAALPLNDDEEERQQARCNTLESSSIVNETLKKVMEIYNANKLSNENAWNVPIIDTLSNLLEKHQPLNKLGVMGTALEASSKVYGMRVDSIHREVLHMSAGLKTVCAFESKKRNGTYQGDNDETEENANAIPPVEGEGKVILKKKKTLKLNSTIVKNKNSLNSRLDTAPLQDPFFAKWNSTVGDINNSNRLMTYILPSKDSELLLHTNYPFWDASELPKDINYLKEMKPTDYKSENWINADWVGKLQGCEDLKLRSRLNSYAIADTPYPIDCPNGEDDGQNSSTSLNQLISELFKERRDPSMTFDFDAECEPMPDLDALPEVLKFDMNDFEELTNDERSALANCKVIKKAAVVIDDLRPTDGKSKLEYSFRPMENISQFWAGPSYWKPKRSRPRGATLTVQASNAVRRNATQHATRSKQLAADRRNQLLNFGEYNEANFTNIETTSNSKFRKRKFQKQWDPRKLKLPTNLKIDKTSFFNYEYAPGLKVSFGLGTNNAKVDGVGDFDTKNVADEDNDKVGSNSDMMETPDFDENIGASSSSFLRGNRMIDDNNEQKSLNETVLEIPTEFEDAPNHITRIVVPFARQSKVVDMKDLKSCFTQLINKELEEHGHSSFNELYRQLCEAQPVKFESLSKSVAFFAVLHLANDLGLFLNSQEGVEDFIISKYQD